MRRGTYLLVILVLAAIALFLSSGLYAGTKVPDVIKMENKAYKKHIKKIVLFQHKKHEEDYAKKHAAFFKNGCGECHHGNDNKPLKNLKEGDAVQGCIECHKKPGVMPTSEKKAMRQAKLSKKEQTSKKVEYHSEAVMKNCVDCHRPYNKKNKLKSKNKGYAPTSCNKCHV